MSQKSPSNGASGAAQHQGASAPLIRIEDVDVVFSRSPKPALDLLDHYNRLLAGLPTTVPAWVRVELPSSDLASPKSAR